MVSDDLTTLLSADLAEPHTAGKEKVKWLVLHREEIKVRAFKLTGIDNFMLKFCSRPLFPKMWPTKLVLKCVIKRVSSQTCKEKNVKLHKLFQKRNTFFSEIFSEIFQKYFLTHFDFITTLIPNLIKLKANLSGT